MSTSLELSEFFDNDDSSGNRLVEFFQKRRPNIQSQKFLFVESEPLRLSVDVQLERIPETKKTVQTDDREVEANEVENEVQQSQPEVTNAPDENNEKGAVGEGASSNAVGEVGGSPNRQENSGKRSLSPEKNALMFSPLRDGIRKSGGISRSDRLRRLTLRRLSNLGNKRRSLFKDTDSTMMTDSGFAPLICSTPLSQGSTNGNGKADDIVAIPQTNVENIAPSVAEQENNAPNHDTLSLSASRGATALDKDGNLRRMMESIVETTLKRVESKKKVDEESQITNAQKTFETPKEHNSSLRRTYTLEKGENPGQIILTPEVVGSPKSNTMEISGFLQRHHQLPSSSSRNSPSRMNVSHKCSTNVSRNSPSRMNVSHKCSVSNQCSRIDQELGEANLTQLEHNAAPENVVNTSHHFAASKELSDMDITPQVNQLRSRTTRNMTNNRRTRNLSQLTISFDSPHVGNSHNSEFCKRNLTANRSIAQLNFSKNGGGGGGVSLSKTNAELCMTPPPPTNPVFPSEVSHVENVFNRSVHEDELVIPETQEQLAQVRNSIVIESTADHLQMVVIPLVHENLCSSAIVASPKSTSHKIEAQKSAIDASNSDAQTLKITDILTDDEDEPIHNTMSETVKSNSQIPLNLAGANNCTRRLRSRLRLQQQHVMSLDTEAEPLPLSLSNHAPSRKRSFKRRPHITLNKAPGAPLNGEEFAKELACMSNYEILDLRKRNSLGRVFAISGRKSLRLKEEAIKKQVLLDDEIEMELLRRNMQVQGVDTVEHMEVSAKDINTAVEELMHEKEICPPVPQEFCDSINLQKEISPRRESSLVDEKSCDRISFRNRNETLRRRKSPRLPDVLEKYLKVSKKFTESKKKMKKGRPMNSSKRLLFSQEFDETLVCDKSNEINKTIRSSTDSLPCVPSPPRSETEQMPPLRVVSPPPPLSMSLQNLQRTVLVVDQTATQILISPSTLPQPQPALLPPPADFETDSNKEPNSSSKDLQNVEGNKNSDAVFKKPFTPPPIKRKKPGRKKKDETLPTVTVNSELTMSASSTDTTAEVSLRRSKRGHVPLKNIAPLMNLLIPHYTLQRSKKTVKKTVKDKNILRENSSANKNYNFFGESCSSCSSTTSTASQQKRKVPVKSTHVTNSHENAPPPSTPPPTNDKIKIKHKKKSAKVVSKAQKNSETLEHSRLMMPTPPPLDHFNNVFDQLRNSSHIDEPATTSEKEHQNVTTAVRQKKLKVRVARLKMSDGRLVLKNKVTPNELAGSAANKDGQLTQHHTSENISTVSSTSDSKQSNIELISWLRNVTDTADNSARSDGIFNEMRISSATNLMFTELQGIEYAFYDTDDCASLGYLRFRPRQHKPKKRAKRYHLHFIALVGNFRIMANEEQSIVGPGDLIAIGKSVFYEIENLSNDISILMVVKK